MHVNIHYWKLKISFHMPVAILCYLGVHALFFGGQLSSDQWGSEREEALLKGPLQVWQSRADTQVLAFWALPSPLQRQRRLVSAAPPFPLHRVLWPQEHLASWGLGRETKCLLCSVFSGSSAGWDLRAGVDMFLVRMPFSFPAPFPLMTDRIWITLTRGVICPLWTK